MSDIDIPAPSGEPEDWDEEEIRTGHSKALRNTLKHARLKAGLSARAVADRIAARLVALGNPDVKPVVPSTIYAWEDFDRHPSISNFAAWARVLGYRLLVELDGADSRRMTVLVNTPEAAEAARTIDRLPAPERARAIAMIRLLIDVPK